MFSKMAKDFLLIGIYNSSQMSDLDRKKAEVRKRMEEQSSAKKKKGFMTPERKKKLRVSKVINLVPLIKNLIICKLFS